MMPSTNWKFHQTRGILFGCVPTPDSALHLINPLGFELDDRRARRAGLDYRKLAKMKDYLTLQDYFNGK